MHLATAENPGSLFAQGSARPPKKNASAAQGHGERPLSGPDRGASTSAAARLQPGHQSQPARRPAPQSRVGLRPAQPTSPRTAPRVFRSAGPQARAQPCSCRKAAERFPGDTGGRSPAVARAVARARRGASPAAKVTGGRTAGRGYTGSPAPTCRAARCGTLVLRPGIPESGLKATASGGHQGFQKNQEPPKNIEEFLKLQNWDYWPKEVIFEDNDIWLYTLNKIKEDSSFNSIYTYLWENVPRIYDTVAIMESRLQECSLLLENHASKIFEWDSIVSETDSSGKLEKQKKFLRKYHKRKMIRLSDKMETKKNIEGCNFPGFKTNELTQLPRHLDAERIYLFILKAHNFDENFFKIWRSHFLSEASIALLHDSFWWWFLHKFKPDKENQDFLFDRISESYVTLFMSIPLSRKDAFFQVYPDCLAQAIYATFQEAFPESSDLFNDEFKEDLGNNIFLWMSGLKPQKGFWTHWKLKELSTTTIHGTKKAPMESIKERIASSQECTSNYIDFNVMKTLKSPTEYVMSTSKEESRLSRLTTKSHYVGIGPKYNHVLFNVGGQSPLILYYLRMHKPSDSSKAPKQTKFKLTELSREPSTAPTYHDIVKEAKRQFERNQKDFRRQQAKATKKPKEAAADSEKFTQRLQSEAKIEREFMASLSSSSSSSSSTEDGNFEEQH
ncbi:protein FAM227B [Saccopteryx leptura]|uniref:protein FAM227B n=1 Tax=Saccopteryx leptura TaxID=249018 RepID=UPI00339C9784